MQVHLWKSSTQTSSSKVKAKKLRLFMIKQVFECGAINIQGKHYSRSMDNK